MVNIDKNIGGCRSLLDTDLRPVNARVRNNKLETETPRYTRLAQLSIQHYPDLDNVYLCLIWIHVTLSLKPFILGM